MATVTAQQQLNDQLVLSTAWFQQSGEYAATTYLAYNAARIAFDQAVASGASNPAVIVDVDETVLDNSPYEAGLIDSPVQFTSASFNQWNLTQLQKAIPGAIDFSNYVNANGGKVFFVTNRALSSTGNPSNNNVELATIANLTNVGFQGVDTTTALLSGEFTGTINGQVSTSKEFRRQAVANGSVDGIQHDVVVLVGDNLNDLDADAGISDSARRAYVDSISNRYGVYTPGQSAYIALSNPIYGDWEGPGLYNPAAFGKDQWFQLTPAEKNIQRKQNLIVWDAPDSISVTSGGPQDRLNEQLVLPINWFQVSGEYAATSYQAYNVAKFAFDQSLSTGISSPSVVLDLDETVLDNSAYDAWLIGTDNQYSDATWNQWILSGEAKAIPGSINFINYVNSNGG